MNVRFVGGLDKLSFRVFFFLYCFARASCFNFDPRERSLPAGGESIVVLEKRGRPAAAVTATYARARVRSRILNTHAARNFSKLRPVLPLDTENVHYELYQFRVFSVLILRKSNFLCRRSEARSFVEIQSSDNRYSRRRTPIVSAAEHERNRLLITEPNHVGIHSSG